MAEKDKQKPLMRFISFQGFSFNLFEIRNIEENQIFNNFLGCLEFYIEMTFVNKIVGEYTKRFNYLSEEGRNKAMATLIKVLEQNRVEYIVC